MKEKSQKPPRTQSNPATPQNQPPRTPHAPSLPQNAPHANLPRAPHPPPRANRLSVSIGIPAYNEEQNIQKLLDALFKQELSQINISEIIVIASGCTDRTVEIVQKIRAARAKSPTQSLHVQTSLRLIIQKERAGKSSAVNLFIKEARENILVLESADTIPAPRTIEHLCAPFLASAGAPAPAAHPAPAAAQPVGLAGAHPVPTNSAKTFIGFCVKTMWEMHHQIALKSPKCGELIAFRRALPAEPATPAIVPGLSSAPGTELKPGTPILTDIPAESAVDEASIEAEILKHNLKIIYVPEAIVYNKGPETVREFIAQRRRIAAGHIWLQKNFQHKISTNNKLSVISLTLSRFSLNPKNDLRLIGMMFLEITAKLLGSYDFYFKKSRHTIWERIGTTKNPNK